jgi:C-5 cytosine-specific DNA methylase
LDLRYEQPPRFSAIAHPTTRSFLGHANGRAESQLPTIRSAKLSVRPYQLTRLSAGFLATLEDWGAGDDCRLVAIYTLHQPLATGGQVVARFGILKRLAATPADGGGWADVARIPETRGLCTTDCLRHWKAGDLGSHPDVFGRMWWDRPDPTIKRECAHIGNGRYAHPEKDRLLTVREMATLQGFPFDCKFPAKRWRTAIATLAMRCPCGRLPDVGAGEVDENRSPPGTFRLGYAEYGIANRRYYPGRKIK